MARQVRQAKAEVSSARLERDAGSRRGGLSWAWANGDGAQPTQPKQMQAQRLCTAPVHSARLARQPPGRFVARRNGPAPSAAAHLLLGALGVHLVVVPPRGCRAAALDRALCELRRQAVACTRHRQLRYRQRAHRCGAMGMGSIRPDRAVTKPVETCFPAGCSPVRGRDMRMDSMRPPVLRPKIVPRSYTRLNST